MFLQSTFCLVKFHAYLVPGSLPQFRPLMLLRSPQRGDAAGWNLAVAAVAVAAFVVLVVPSFTRA